MIVGTATVEIQPNAAAFGPKTEAAVKAALAGIEANIELTLDENGLRQKIEAAVLAATAGTTANIDVDADTTGFEAKVRAAEAVLDDIEIGVDIDGSGAESELRRLIATLEATNKLRLHTSSGGSGFGASGIGSDAGPVGDAVGGIFGRAVIRGAFRVLAAAGLAQLFTAATSGVVNLTGALIAAASAVGSVASIAASLPGLFAAAAQAAGTIALALGGVKGAFQAYVAQKKAIGAEAFGGGGGQSEASARAAERAIRNATRGIEDAQRSAADAVEAANERMANSIESVADAERDLADTYEDSARRVEDAERDVARAHRNAQEAQEALTRAREDAREEADDLRRSVERLSLTEAEARRRLQEAKTRQALEQKRAQQDLTGVTEDTLRALERQADLEDKAASNPREKAANDLRDAELDLDEVLQKRRDTEAKLAESERTGVEGSEKVVAAKEKLVDANQAVADSERDLVRTQRDTARALTDAQERVTDAIKDQTKAQRDMVRAQEDGARRIADAQEALADAIASAAESAAGAVGGATGAINRFEAALAALAPATRHFVEFLIGLEPRLRAIQAVAAEGLLPGLEVAITNLLPLLDDFTPIIFDTGRALAGLAIQASLLVASPAFRTDLQLIGRRNIEVIKTLGAATLSTLSFLRHITVAAGPLTQHLADLTAHFADLADKAAAAGRDNGGLEAFFRRVADRLDKLLITIGFLGRALLNIFREATPAGDRYLDSLVRLSARLDLIVERAKDSGALRDFFESTRPAVEAVAGLVGDLAKGLAAIGTSNTGGFVVFVNQLRDELLPTLLKVISTLDTGFLSALVTLVSEFADLAGAILSFNPTLTLFVTLLGGMAEGIAHLLTDIPIVSPLIQGLVTVLGAISVATAVGGLITLAEKTLFAGKAVQFLTSTTTAAAASQTLLGRGLGLLGRAFAIAGVVYALKAAADSLAPSIDKVTKSVTGAKDAGAEFEKQVQRLNNPGIKDQLLLFAKNPVDALKLATDAILSFGAKSGENFDRATKDVAAFEAKFKTSLPAAFRAVAETSVAQGQRVIDSLKAQGKETGLYELILKDVITAKAKQGLAEEDVQRKIDDATEALKGNNTEMQKHIDKMHAAAAQALALSGAEIGMEQAFDDLTEAVSKDSTAFDINEQAGRDAKRALDGFISSIQTTIDEFGKSAAAGHLDAEAKERILNNLDRLQHSGYPGAEAAAARLRQELEAIKPVYTANVDVDTTRAIAQIDDLTTRLEYLSRVGVSAANNINTGTAGDPGAREFGGRVERNRAYIVGEKRAELFVPDVAGTVLPTVPDLASLVPFGVSNSIGDVNLMPASSNFDADGVAESLRRFEESLADHLSDFDDRIASRRDAPAPTDGSGSVVVEQTINGPLITIDNTFGPGSSVGDLLAAMEGVADQRIIEALAKLLKDHAAGVGTRGTS